MNLRQPFSQAGITAILSGLHMGGKTNVSPEAQRASEPHEYSFFPLGWSYIALDMLLQMT